MRAPEAGGHSAPESAAQAPLTPAYIAAMDAHNQAMRAYRRAHALRALGAITSEQFLAARAERDAAHRAFEAAYDAALAGAR